ncbi:MAG: type II toxin-antitoxin system HicB family antitoxin [Lautropia sp.]
MKYAIVIEQRGRQFRAYVPDLPGCMASGVTAEEASHAIRLAMRYHVDALKSDGASVPRPSSRVDYVRLSA